MVYEHPETRKCIRVHISFLNMWFVVILIFARNGASRKPTLLPVQVLLPRLTVALLHWNVVAMGGHESTQSCGPSVNLRRFPLWTFEVHPETWHSTASKEES